jgi:acyl-CoA thioesterase-1
MKDIFFLFLWFFLSSLMPEVKVSEAASEPKAILFLGNSLTAGYGLDATQSFPALIQDRIDSLGWNFKVINAGQSGDTSSGGLSRIDWLLRREFQVLVLELGINDGLRGIHVEVTRQNLQAVINRTKSRYPGVKVVVAGMQVPPNMGVDYASSFRAIFSQLAKKNGAQLIPFLLEGVGGNPKLNLPDGIHPSVEGHKIVAENVWKVLEPILRSMK